MDNEGAKVMRHKLIDAHGVVHGYSSTKAKLHRYLNENYPTNGTRNALPCSFEILRVRAGELSG